MDSVNVSKPITLYNEWFISAIKSSKVDGSIQPEKLLQNCLNCYNQVKATITSQDDQPQAKLDEIRLNTTMILVLGCSAVNSLQELSKSSELMPLIKSIPNIDIDTFYLVIKGLKNNKYLRGVFPWLSSSIVALFLSHFQKLSKNLTPLSLALCFEMFYSLLYSSQYDISKKDIVINSIRDYLCYLQDFERKVCEDPKSKLMAYYFMYIIEVIHTLLKYLNHKGIEEPFTYSMGLKLKAVKINLNKSHELQYESCLEKSINELSSVLNNLVLCISSDIWIFWHDLKVPKTICDETINFDFGKNINVSIQMKISHTVFKIMEIKKEITSPKDILNLGINKELGIFLGQIAVDPDYDSDKDLTTLDLIEAIKEGNEDKKKKLLAFLLNRDDVFEFEESLLCLKANTTSIARSVAFPFIKNFIQMDKKINQNEDWKLIILALSRQITNEDVITILREDLQNGHSDILRTNNFSSDFTQIFNQLSHQSDKECFDSYLRLCLQNGVDVVKYSIDMVISVSGLSPILTSAFHIISFICRSKEESGLCLVTKLLMDKLALGLPLEMENEFFSFLFDLLNRSNEEVLEDCFKELVTATTGPASSFHSNCLPVDIEEIFEHLVYPRLKMHSEDEASLFLFNILKVLKRIVDQHCEIILKSHLRLSCIASLIIIHSNCCILNNSNFNYMLKIRNIIEKILYNLEKLFVKDLGNYEEDFALLKICLSHYDLHYRSTWLLARFMEEKCTENAESPVDQIFNCLNKKNLDEDDYSIPDCSRVEWIWALYNILPSSSEDEWLAAFSVTHSFLNRPICDSRLVMPTLKLIEEVLLLVHDNAKYVGKSLPFQHYFKSYYNAAMKFVNEKVTKEEEQFFLYVNIFVWWCKMQTLFDCNPEYTVLFLNLLVGALNDLISEKNLIKNGKSHTKSRSSSENSSSESLSSESRASINENHVPSNGFDSKCLSNHEAESKSEFSVSHLETENKLDVSVSHPDNVDNENEEKRRKSRKSSLSEVISRSDFNDSLNSMVKSFIGFIRPSELTSAVAAKLKGLCEL